MWKGQKDMHGFSGVDGNRTNLNDCIRLCQTTPNCTGVDWNQQDVACWVNANSPVIVGNQPNITFFVKNCNDSLPTTSKKISSETPNEMRNLELAINQKKGKHQRINFKNT